MIEVFIGLIIPFCGTALGSAFVFVLKKNIGILLQRILLGFAAGVMVAAAIWSLILPAIEQSLHLNNLCFLPAAVGILLGFIFLFIIEIIANNLDKKREKLLNDKNKSLLVFSITLHNIPEGMAVGVALAAAYFQNSFLSLTTALALSLGISIQNIPEGAIVSIPKLLNGNSKCKSFFAGVLSGIVEPISGLIAFFITGLVTPILPYILAFSAGSMLFVVVKEIIPEMQEGKKSGFATFGFCIGFILMMILDVLLG